MGCAASAPEHLLPTEGDEGWAFFDMGPVAREIARLRKISWPGRVCSIPILPVAGPSASTSDLDPSKDEVPGDGDECAICMEVLFRPVMTNCAHKFCYACWEQYSAAFQAKAALSCPCCRTETNAERMPEMDAPLMGKYPRVWARRECEPQGLHGCVFVCVPEWKYVAHNRHEPSARARWRAPPAHEDVHVPPLVNVGFGSQAEQLNVTYEGDAESVFKIAELGGYTLRGLGAMAVDGTPMGGPLIQRLVPPGGVKLLKAGTPVASLVVDTAGNLSAYACDLPIDQPTSKSCAASQQHLCGILDVSAGLLAVKHVEEEQGPGRAVLVWLILRKLLLDALAPESVMGQGS